MNTSVGESSQTGVTERNSLDLQGGPVFDHRNVARSTAFGVPCKCSECWSVQFNREVGESSLFFVDRRFLRFSCRRPPKPRGLVSGPEIAFPRPDQAASTETLNVHAWQVMSKSAATPPRLMNFSIAAHVSGTMFCGGSACGVIPGRSRNELSKHEVAMLRSAWRTTCEMAAIGCRLAGKHWHA